MFNILHIEKKLGLHFLVLNLAIIQSCFFLKRVNYWVIFNARNRCLIFKTGVLSNPANFQDWRVYAQRNAINCICSHRSCLQAQHSFLKQRILIAAKHDPDFILLYLSLFISILDVYWLFGTMTFCPAENPLIRQVMLWVDWCTCTTPGGQFIFLVLALSLVNYKSVYFWKSQSSTVCLII